MCARIGVWSLFRAHGESRGCCCPFGCGSGCGPAAVCLWCAPARADPAGHLVGTRRATSTWRCGRFCDSIAPDSIFNPPFYYGCCMVGSPVWRRHRVASRRVGVVQPLPSVFAGVCGVALLFALHPPMRFPARLGLTGACWRPGRARARPLAGGSQARMQDTVGFALAAAAGCIVLRRAMSTVRPRGRRLPRPPCRAGCVCPPFHRGAADPLQHGLCACSLVAWWATSALLRRRPVAASCGVMAGCGVVMVLLVLPMAPIALRGSPTTRTPISRL